MIKLKRVTANIADRRLFRKLFDYYRHDLSGFTDNFDDCRVTQSGTYKYERFARTFTHPGLRPYLIYYKGQVSGFIVVTRPPHFSKDRKTAQVAELFILNGYRRKGIAAETMRRIFRKYPGKYAVGQLVRNRPATTFWRHLYKESHIQYTEKVESFADGFRLRVQRFVAESGRQDDKCSAAG